MTNMDEILAVNRLGGGGFSEALSNRLSPKLFSKPENCCKIDCGIMDEVITEISCGEA